MGRLKKPKTHLSHEFDLDLAPLLAVMVKLVPVLLISSAFVQVMVVETDLPQVVKQAIAEQPQKPKATIHLEISRKTGIKVIVAKDGTQKAEQIPNSAEATYDLTSLQKTLQKVKSANPDVFKIELAPESTVAYKDIVKIMDEARRSRDHDVRFPIFDKKENKPSTTDYMFPDVVFANMMDG
jgi:biopolymer transport protein ExbD